jgi:antirestriction protein ArdC
MPRHVRKARIGIDRTNFYDDITRKIIAELERGCVPWVQPWGAAVAKAPLAMPRNAATYRRYSGRREPDSSASMTARFRLVSHVCCWSGPV